MVRKVHKWYETSMVRKVWFPFSHLRYYVTRTNNLSRVRRFNTNCIVVRHPVSSFVSASPFVFIFIQYISLPLPHADMSLITSGHVVHFVFFNFSLFSTDDDDGIKVYYLFSFIMYVVVVVVVVVGFVYSVIPTLRRATGATVYGMVWFVRFPAGGSADRVAARSTPAVSYDRHGQWRRRTSVSDRQFSARVLCRRLPARNQHVPYPVWKAHSHLIRWTRHGSKKALKEPPEDILWGWLQLIWPDISTYVLSKIQVVTWWCYALDCHVTNHAALQLGTCICKMCYGNSNVAKFRSSNASNNLRVASPRPIFGCRAVLYNAFGAGWRRGASNLLFLSLKHIKRNSRLF